MSVAPEKDNGVESNESSNEIEAAEDGAGAEPQQTEEDTTEEVEAKTESTQHQKMPDSDHEKWVPAICDQFDIAMPRCVKMPVNSLRIVP